MSGLSSADVAARVAAGKVNRTENRSSRRVGEILRANLFTRFNAVIAALAGTVLVLGEPRDALFGFVMVANIVIGVTQEWRAKRTLDRLTLISADKVTVWRDGATQEIAPTDLVLDDLFELAPGDQVVVDGKVVRTDGLAVDESMLTGEADAVVKAQDDEVRSGSFVVAGGGTAVATAVGADSYAERLTAEARKFEDQKSELARGIDQILRVVTWAIIPTAVIVFFGQRADGEPVKEALVGAVAGVVALVPQGLVLLLSMALAVAVIRLGRHQVLVQELQAVETLARVTILASDKTGTLTDGAVEMDGVEPLESAGAVDDALAALAGADEYPNATMKAIQLKFPSAPSWPVEGRVAFNSAHKYSAVDFGGDGSWYLGAPEVMLPTDHAALQRVEELATDGKRVLLLACAAAMTGDGLPDDLSPQALLVFTDRIRPDAAQTIEYFLKENVRPKVISGDNPVAVAAIAMRCGVPDADRYVDARDLPSEQSALTEAAQTNAVFGRVTPERKRELLHALQGAGEVVAMTGDGVNDTLALKDADLGIAMGSGTPAAKSVSKLVLLDDKFATLPLVVAEGRRVIANIERVARLFVTKNVWAAVLAVLTGLLTVSYPILPRQLSVIDALTIGIPGFVLSFQPNHDPVRTGFIRRVLRFSIPAGFIVGLAAMCTFFVGREVLGFEKAEAQSGTTLALCALGIWVLFQLARPLDALRLALVLSMMAGTVLVFTVPFLADFFELDIPPADFVVWIAVIVTSGALLIHIALSLVDRRVASTAASSPS